MRNLLIFSTLFLCLIPFASAKIVFVIGWEIFTMDDDGSNVRQLTYNKVYDGDPRWAPNGKYIAFDRAMEREHIHAEQNHDLFLMNPDGTGERQLTIYTGLDVSQTWSPDSQHLAFSTTRSDKWSIHIMDIETQEVHELTRDRRKSHYSGSAAWAPDGKKIAYILTQIKPFQETIYIVNADGTNPRPFTRTVDAFLYRPQWSPDGKYILYGETKMEGNRQVSDKIIIRTARDGLLVREVEMPNVDEYAIGPACWMGTKHVLFEVLTDFKPSGLAKHDIYRYTLATGEIINLTNSPRNEGAPDWIDDAALPVILADKLTLRWGQLKQLD